MSTNPSLQKLAFSEGHLTTAFDPKVYSYILEVPEEVVQLTIEAEASDPKAEIYISPGDNDSDAPGFQLAVDVIKAMGVTITVTSEEGDAVKYYVGATNSE